MTVRKLVVGISAAALAAGLCGPLHAYAGSGSSGVCGDGDNDINIISTPIEAGLELGELNTLGPQQPGYIGGCYSTTPNGFTGGEETGGAVYVQIPVVANASEFQPQHVAGFGCVPDANPQFVATSCWFATDPQVQRSGDTVAVSMPFGICAGVGGAALPAEGTCQGSAPGIGTTGIAAGSVGLLSAPAGTDTGGGVVVNNTTLYLNGVPFTLPGGGAVQGGVGSHSVAAGPGNAGAPVCAANGLVCEPAPSFILALTGTQYFASVSALGEGQSVGSPVGHYCILNVNSTVC